MKRVLRFAEIIAYVFGAIGGFSYCATQGVFYIALAILVLAVMAFPEFKAAVMALHNGESKD